MDQGKKKSIFVLLSRHHTFVELLAECLSGKGFTHASIGLEEEKGVFYSFGIKGFQAETPQKWVDLGIKLQLYEIPVTNEQYNCIKEGIEEMQNHSKEFHYNFFGLLMGLLHIPINLKKRYFCSQYVAKLLTDAGIITPERKENLFLPKHFSQYFANRKLARMVLHPQFT